MRQQRVFTEEEKLLIASWYVNGKSSNTIAKEFRTAPSKVMEIIKEKGKDIHCSGRKRRKNRPTLINKAPESNEQQPAMAPTPSTKKDPLMPPVGNEWKPWMIPTEIIIPEDTSALNWEEYAKDYDRRKAICDERNELLRKNQSK